MKHSILLLISINIRCKNITAPQNLNHAAIPEAQDAKQRKATRILVLESRIKNLLQHINIKGVGEVQYGRDKGSSKAWFLKLLN